MRRNIQEYTERVEMTFSFFCLRSNCSILIMIICHKLPLRVSYDVFRTLHPIHVVLNNALVTASIYELHKRKECKLWSPFLIGYLASIGIDAFSDSVIPYWRKTLLNLPDKEIHIGFIEKWWLINPLTEEAIRDLWCEVQQESGDGRKVQ